TRHSEVIASVGSRRREATKLLVDDRLQGRWVSLHNAPHSLDVDRTLGVRGDVAEAIDLPPGNLRMPGFRPSDKWLAASASVSRRRRVASWLRFPGGRALVRRGCTPQFAQCSLECRTGDRSPAPRSS